MKINPIKEQFGYLVVDGGRIIPLGKTLQSIVLLSWDPFFSKAEAFLLQDFTLK
jgi:hypothetical protein